MKQENTKFNVFKINRKKKDLESILNNYKEEVNDLRNQIDKSIEYLDKLMKENNSK